VRAAGASVAMVSGSGPTVFGLFPTPERARRAAAALGAIAAVPVGPDFGRVRAA
jgi:4-diphosphocytidyl-2-C-methyl-D-erythritol kinase